MDLKPIEINYFSDILCVWAYVAQIRLEELDKNFADQIKIIPFHVTLFGDTHSKIAEKWKARGGYSGFGDHVIGVCDQFPELQVNPQVWKSCQPKSSGMAHLFLKAIQVIEQKSFGRENSYELVSALEWDFRLAFFRDARDISDVKILYDIAHKHSINKKFIEDAINDGTAMSLFCSEIAMKEQFKLEGSPTYVLNNSRQKLYGNVGYKIIEANVAEAIANRGNDIASWC